MVTGISDYDSNNFVKFCSPLRVSKELHFIEGFFTGISVDKKITDSEIDALQSWLQRNEDLALKPPFSELVSLIAAALEDEMITQEERQDILWFCAQFSDSNKHYSGLTADMQRLQGILLGIAADNVIEKEELDQVSKWIEEHDQLKGYWPYDEIDSLITTILADGKIDDKEHHFILNFCKEFKRSSPSLLLEPVIDKELMLNGVCAVCPDISFKNNVFCFTGRSKKASRKEFADIVIAKGGLFVPQIRKDVNFLIVGAEGNSCWAFSCYGRKVEEAVNLRKDGEKIVITHEYDFWDAIADAN